MNLRLSLVALGLFVVGCGAGGRGPSDSREPMLSCEGLSRDECATSSGCYVEDLACIAVCLDPDGTGDCQSPCAEDFRCLPRPASCEALDQQACEADARCEYVQYACPAVCIDDGRGGCLPCNAPPSHCQPRATPVSCYGLSPDDCDAHPECEFVARNDCFCSNDPACTCPVIEPSCQPVSRCEALSPQQCVEVPGCGLLEVACACPFEALCDCAPQTHCVDVTEPQPDPCAGLDLAACTTDARCEVGHLLCTTECRDDGHGGCLPCPDTALCQLRVEEPIAGCGGGGAPPPSP